MAKNEMLTCPLCQGHSQVSRSELIDLLTDRSLGKKIEHYLSELVHAGEAAEVGAQQSQVRDFQKEVHSWNPQLPIWRRSPKE